MQFLDFQIKHNKFIVKTTKDLMFKIRRTISFFNKKQNQKQGMNGY